MSISFSRPLRSATAGVLIACATTTVAAQAPHPASLVQVRGEIRGEDIVRTAKHYLGVPYRLGGTTPRAFDCSGFVRYVFAQHGIAMPRTAHEQAAYGTAPSIRELEPGDLLFFYGGRGAQHIAIYAGNDSIIHASSSGHRVKLDRVYASRSHPNWFGQRLIAVRRILPAEGVFSVPSTTALPLDDAVDVSSAALGMEGALLAGRAPRR